VNASRYERERPERPVFLPVWDGALCISFCLLEWGHSGHFGRYRNGIDNYLPSIPICAARSPLYVRPMPSTCSVSGAHLRRLPILGLAQCSFDRIHTVPVVHLGAASFFFHAAAYLHRYAAALAVPRCSPTRTRRTTTLRHRCSASARQGLAPRQVSDTGASHPRLWSSPCPHHSSSSPPWTLMQGGSWDQSSLANNVSTMLLTSPPSTEWYADSGAGSHMVNTAGILSASHPPRYLSGPSSIIFSNGALLPVTSVGPHSLSTPR
jgi:hypothetical protein